MAFSFPHGFMLQQQPSPGQALLAELRCATPHAGTHRDGPPDTPGPVAGPSPSPSSEGLPPLLRAPASPPVSAG